MTTKTKTIEKTDIKTVDVDVKEWFDRVNGNSYFAGSVTTNYGMEDQKTNLIPFQYGYGDHYRHIAFKVLQDMGLIPKQDDMAIYWRYYEENGIIARHNKQENCRKRDLK